MARPKLAELPDWPRMLTADMAASYCSMSADRFRSLCPVAPLYWGAQARWDRLKVDVWLTQLGERGGPGNDPAPDDAEAWVDRL